MGQGVGNAASVTDDIESFVRAFQILIDIHFHIIEFHFDTVQQGIVICRTRCDLIQGVDHLDDTVQDTFWQNQTQISGSSGQGRANQTFFDTVDGTASATHQIAETLYDHTATQHIGETGDTLAVSVTVFEWLGEVFGYQQGEVRVFCVFCRIFIAVTVCGYDAVRILIYHDTVGIHTEGTDIILELLGAVYDLALIQLIGEMGEDNGREFDTDAQIDTVGFCRNLQILTDSFHPFAAASTDRDDTLFTGGSLIFAIMQGVHGIVIFDRSYRSQEEEIHLLFQFIVQIFQNHIVDIRSQMTDRSIQQFQLVLDTQLFEFGSGCGEHTGIFTAVGDVDLIHVFHQIQSGLFADMLVKSSAEVVGDIVFSIGKCTGAAETAHDRAGFAADTGFYFFTVDGTVAFA